MKKVRQVGY